MRTARTEISFVSGTVDIAGKAGFSELGESANLNPGSRYYTYAVSAKVDVYMLYRAMSTYFQHAG